MNQSVIESRIIKTELVKWQELQFIQQEDFKEWLPNGDKKLIESLVKYQFADPFKVWHHNGVNYCLDGRHRFLDLKMVSENVSRLCEVRDKNKLNFKLNTKTYRYERNFD